tara:strand:- start:10 stop:444 length:435 start_codon:yes stop_codon:yes gene_type:complete
MKGAGFFKRVFALIYDTLAVIGIILSLSLLLILVNGPIDWDTFFETNNLARWIQFLILVLSGPSFYTFFWLANDGQTLGMQAWKIQLIREKGDLSVSVCLLRCLISVISILIFGLGYLLILVNKDNKSLSDLITNTQIIDLKKT